MSFKGSGNLPPPPPMLPEPAQAPAAPTTGKRRKNRSVRSQTVLTSGLGVLEQPNLDLKTLLGG